MTTVHHSPVYTREYPAVIAAAITTSWSVMVFCVRVYLRLSTKRSFGADDIACAVGMVRPKAVQIPACFVFFAYIGIIVHTNRSL